MAKPQKGHICIKECVKGFWSKVSHHAHACKKLFGAGTKQCMVLQALPTSTY